MRVWSVGLHENNKWILFLVVFLLITLAIVNKKIVQTDI